MFRAVRGAQTQETDNGRIVVEGKRSTADLSNLTPWRIVASVALALVLTSAHRAAAQTPAPEQPSPPVETQTLRPGQFVSPSDAPPPEESATDFQTDEPFSATYIGAPVNQVADEILGDFLQTDYTIAPDVSGTVTLRIDNVRSRLAAIDALRSAVSPLGIAVIDRGDVVALARSTGQAEPARGSAIVPGDPSPPGGGVVIMSPRFILPSQLSPLLTPFAQSGAVVSVDDGRRFLILRGDEATIGAASSAAKMFDVDWFSQISTASFRLNHVSPKDLISEMKPLLGPSAALADLIPIPRLSTIMVMSRSPDMMKRVAELIGRLDQPSAEESPGLLIYRAKHVSARDLAAALSGGGADSGSNRSSVLSEPQDNAAGAAGGAGAGTGAGQGFSRSFSSQTSEAAATAPVSGGSGGLSASANMAQNIVIVRGDATSIAEAKQLLAALDRLPPQILIEAAIAEITLNDELQYGVNWSSLEERLEATFTDAPDGDVTARFPGLALTYINTDIQAAISLLSSVTSVEVISRPSLVALNNETAELQVGDQVPIVTQTAVSVLDPDAPIVNQTTYRDTGVILSVTPRVRAGGLVEIDVAQEVSQVARTTSSGIDSPTIQQRRLSSRLIVPSGKSVALGGLISSSKSVGDLGIPVLKDIPLLGRLFRSTSTFEERTELVVFLTPKVMVDPQDAVDATELMRRSFHKLEQELAPAQ